jgi:tRNA pseudouridine55 synthase
VGSATRLAEYLPGLPKTYSATMRLGEETDTHDRTGTVSARSEVWRALSREQVAAALERRAGRQLQVPPAYSAKKVAGERLYAKARRGEQVTPKAVTVEIASIRLTGWDPPFASFETTCSSGTYIRAIARDVGADLETFAHLVELRRTAIGRQSVMAAVTIQQLQQGEAEGHMLDPLEALSHLPRLPVDDTDAAAIQHGRAIAAPAEASAPAMLVVWRDRLLAVGSAAGGLLRPVKVFHA